MKRLFPLFVGLIVGACQSSAPSAVDTTSPSIGPSSSTTIGRVSTTAVPTTTLTTTTAPGGDLLVDGGELTVFVGPFGSMSDRWQERVFGYGEAPGLLGTAPGGEGLMLGPEYGAQTADGRWWFMDAAKQRIARYDPDGAYQAEVVLEPDVLVDGSYFQYQMPQALDDDSLAVAGLRGEDEIALLRVVDDVASVVTFAGSVPWVTTDGTYLYGLDLDGAVYRLDPVKPPGAPVDYLQTRGGEPFMVTVDGDALVVDFPDRDVTGRLLLRAAADPDVVVHGGIEVESGVDGTVYILFMGAAENDETTGVGTLITIGPAVTVSSEPVVDPFSPADPGSPAHLGVTPGSSRPWLMTVFEDGVHVFTPR